MVFDTNNTSLGYGYGSIDTYSEGYGDSSASGTLLVESAFNEYAMFEALLQVEATEMQLCESFSGYTLESELSALREASIKGLKDKIIGGLMKFAKKVASIFISVAAKIMALSGNDEKLVDKFKGVIDKKDQIGKLKVKWKTIKKSPSNSTYFSDLNASASGCDDVIKDIQYNEDMDTMKNSAVSAISSSFTSYSSLKDDLKKACFEDESEKTIAEIGGAKAICDFLSGIKKTSDQLKKAAADINTGVKKTIARLQRENKHEKKWEDNSNKSDSDNAEVSDLARQLKQAQAFQAAFATFQKALLDCVKEEIKQYRAAFTKMVSANNDKLSESADGGYGNTTYSSIIAEVAANEVDDVFDAAISTENISAAISAADKAVMNNVITNDPDVLVYDINDGYKTKHGLPSQNNPYTRFGESSIFDNVELI